MGSEQAPGVRVKALRTLMDRLGSPDLSLGEAKDLRCRLLELTGRDEAEGAACSPASQAASPTMP
jgi:hypothetical protein